MEWSTHSVFSRRASPPLRQTGSQLDEHILHIVHRHIRRDGPHNDGGAAVVLGLDACILQQFLVLQDGQLFLRGKVDLHRHQKHLGGHIAVIFGELLKQDTLVGGVLIDEAEFPCPLGDDVGAEHLPHQPQRLTLGCGGQRRLLRGAAGQRAEGRG